MAEISSVIQRGSQAASGAAVPRGRARRGEFFSLGGALAPYATTKLALAPWAFAAALLTTLAFWDPLARGGEADAILLGLAAYELLIGLTRGRDSGCETSAAPD